MGPMHIPKTEDCCVPWVCNMLLWCAGCEGAIGGPGKVLGKVVGLRNRLQCVPPP